RANPNCVDVDIKPFVADIDIVIACREISTGPGAQCDVAVTLCVKERLKTIGRVAVAVFAVRERFTTDGRVVVATPVFIERTRPVGRIVVAYSDPSERSTTHCRVVG